MRQIRRFYSALELRRRRAKADMIEAIGLGMTDSKTITDAIAKLRKA